jgi:hypothetical protein
MKQKFNLYGGGFQHAKSSTLYKECKYIIWDYNSSRNKITFSIDDYIFYNLKNIDDKIHYGWLLESKFITPDIVDFCMNNTVLLKKKYTNIFTHNTDLINLDPSFYKFCPANGTWIDEIKLRDKTKLVSMISSNKLITSGHKKRIEIIKKYFNKVDLYGRGFSEIQKKEQGLEDYMFSICVENGIYQSYFTEKILDCFATATVPLYVGTKDVKKYFNEDGIIFLDENFDINSLSTELYKGKIEAIKDNLERVKKFNVAEDWLYENYFMDK